MLTRYLFYLVLFSLPQVSLSFSSHDWSVNCRWDQQVCYIHYTFKSPYVGTMTRQVCKNLVNTSPSFGKIRCDFEAVELHFQRAAVALFASQLVVRNQP
jgi:hypothetical protein